LGSSERRGGGAGKEKKRVFTIGKNREGTWLRKKKIEGILCTRKMFRSS